MKSKRTNRRAKPEQGVVLIWTALLIFAMIGMLGLAVDLGRMYIVKGELQNYTDAAAFAAAMELNGLQSGLDRARTSAAGLPNKWDFASRQVSSTQRNVVFGESASGDSNGNWSTAPSNSDIPDMTFVRVGARVDVPLFFASVLGAGPTASVAAQTVAGKETAASVAPGNMLPLAPMAANAADPANFGFVFGQRYALRWSSNIGNNNAPPSGSACAGDLALGWGAGSTIARQRARDPLRGYWGSSSGATLSDWIENGYPFTVDFGDMIPVYTGSKNGRKSAMQNRVESDDDHTTSTYTAYENNESAGDRVGNGRRVVVVPVIAGTVTHGGGGGNGNGDGSGDTEDGDTSSSGDEQVIGFAAFFLNDLDYEGTNGNDPFCGEYIGTFTQGANATSGGGKAGVTKIRIVR